MCDIYISSYISTCKVLYVRELNIKQKIEILRRISSPKESQIVRVKKYFFQLTIHSMCRIKYRVIVLAYCSISATD